MTIAPMQTSGIRRFVIVNCTSCLANETSTNINTQTIADFTNRGRPRLCSFLIHGQKLAVGAHDLRQFLYAMPMPNVELRGDLDAQAIGM